MYQQARRPRRSWAKKFHDAFHGAWHGVAGQDSFWVHFAFAGAVVIAAAVLRASLMEWCLLVLCIAVVLAAEMFNSALEHLSRAITDEHNPHVGTGLNVGSAAVLVAAIGASIVGTLVLGYRLGACLGWWS